MNNFPRICMAQAVQIYKENLNWLKTHSALIFLSEGLLTFNHLPSQKENVSHDVPICLSACASKKIVGRVVVSWGGKSAHLFHFSFFLLKPEMLSLPAGQWRESHSVLTGSHSAGCSMMDMLAMLCSGEIRSCQPQRLISMHTCTLVGHTQKHSQWFPIWACLLAWMLVTAKNSLKMEPHVH